MIAHVKSVVAVHQTIKEAFDAQCSAKLMQQSWMDAAKYEVEIGRLKDQISKMCI